jgi:dTDP-4-dehydrorhamnose reductase
VNKLLLTGADTMLGANLALALRDRWKVVLIGGDSMPAFDGCQTISCDLSDRSDVVYRVLSEAPRGIIHCGGLARSAWDLANTDVVIDTQQEVAHAQALATAAERAGCPLVVLSTDAVFAGPRMFHCEISPTSATHAAADAAKTLERSLAATTALVVRTHAYGWSPAETEAGFAETIWTKLISGLGCPVDSQNYATPILATDLASLLIKAMESNLRGLYHLTGAERASQYRFAAEMAVSFGLTGRQVLLEPPKRRLSSRPFMEETSLNIGVARRDLRMPLPMLREGLSRFAEQATNGFRDELRSAWRPQRRREHAA